MRNIVSDLYVAAIIATVSLVTIALRLAPFLLIGYLSKSAWITYLSSRMPLGIMFLLVAYTFLGVDFITWPHGLPLLSSAVLLLVVQYVSGNMLLAITAGLCLHVYLLS